MFLPCVDAQLDEFVEAGKSCEKVLAEEPDNVKAVFRLGQVFNGLHEYEKAERHWKHAAKLVRSLAATWTWCFLLAAVSVLATGSLEPFDASDDLLMVSEIARYMSLSNISSSLSASARRRVPPVTTRW